MVVNCVPCGGGVPVNCVPCAVWCTVCRGVPVNCVPCGGGLSNSGGIVELELGYKLLVAFNNCPQIPNLLTELRE